MSILIEVTVKTQDRRTKRYVLVERSRRYGAKQLEDAVADFRAMVEREARRS